MESYTRECVFGQGKVNEEQPLYGELHVWMCVWSGKGK